MKLPFHILLLSLFLFLATISTASAQRDPTSLKAGVSFVWLSDYDSQGLMFSNKLSHYFTKNITVGMNVGLLSAFRYDDLKEIYSVQNTFLMATLEGSIDMINNESVIFRVGGGPGVRYRAEINSDAEDTGTVDGSVIHIKSNDFGFNGYLENDFNILRNGVAGGRIDYFYYTSGTPVLALGFHIGFKF
ncbi:hypothetical protein ACFSRY_06140 [Pontibacter locisalis]|uniref:Outer membrane protein beta-barrel domain-containing protein n=1 Tax=Pontibacter locisalis TaxID=1719035 RepID=A0ABW5IKW1_9BACT